jgi:quinol monooxygenase YgiN
MMMTSIKVILPRKHRKDVLEALSLFKRMTEISEGCIGCHINRDVEKPNTITFSEEWQSREDLERHILSPNYRLLLEITELSAQEPEIKVLTITKVEGLEVVEALRYSI